MSARWIPMTCLFVTLTCAEGRSPVYQAPSRAATRAHPLEGDKQAERAGAKLYLRECAACHGQKVEGRGRAPAFKRAEVYEAPAGTLFWVLRDGSLDRGMPSFCALARATALADHHFLAECTLGV